MTAHPVHPFHALDRHAGKRSRVWLVLPVLGFGLLAACLLVLWWEPPARESVSSIHRHFREIALSKSPRPGVDDGGAIGPWWVTASEVDPVTGVFHNFHVRSGPILMAARTARLEVDPGTDTFQFELFNVSFTSVPDSDVNPPVDHTLLQLEHHTLGPVPYGMDIVPDQNAAPASLTGLPETAGAGY